MLAARTCPAGSASAALLASRPCAAAGVALAARWDGQNQGERGERWLLHGHLRAAVAALPGASTSLQAGCGGCCCSSRVRGTPGTCRGSDGGTPGSCSSCDCAPMVSSIPAPGASTARLFHARHHQSTRVPSACEDRDLHTYVQKMFVLAPRSGEEPESAGDARRPHLPGVVC